MAFHNNTTKTQHTANNRRIPRRTIREVFPMNDYINNILQRLKKCQQCETPFLDLTKSRNRKFCSLKCREHQQNMKQTTKIRHHHYYLRKIKPTQRLRQNGHNYFIGTITEKDLDKRIQKLLSLCSQYY
jgi:hypothetical protein